MSTSNNQSNDRPKESTISLLYGQAYKCAFPGCDKPLIKVVDDVRIRNSVVAHIHAKSQGGPRWIEMPPEENRGFDNLILLCDEHHSEIDNKALEKKYPAELLRQWKENQLKNYVDAHLHWELTDQEVKEVLEVSFPYSTETTEQTLLSVTRNVVKLVESSISRLNNLKGLIVGWEAMVAKANYGFSSYDPDTGKRYYAEPSYNDAEAHRRLTATQLDEVKRDLEGLVTDLLADIAALKIVRQDLRQICELLENCIRALMTAINDRPKKPPFFDPDEFEIAIENIQRSYNLLERGWLFEDATGLLEPELPEPPPEPSEEDKQLREWWQKRNERLDKARRYVRGEKLPYHRATILELIEDAKELVYLPKVVSYLGNDFSATLGIASYVTRNATDEEILALADEIQGTKPEVVEATFILRVCRFMEENERLNLVDQLRTQYQEVATSGNWKTMEWWDENGFQIDNLIQIYQKATSPEKTKQLLDSVLAENEELYPMLLRNLAPWVESRSTTYGGEDIFRQEYRTRMEIPNWYPIEKVIEIAHEKYPDIEPQTRPSSDKYEDKISELTSQILAASEMIYDDEVD